MLHGNKSATLLNSVSVKIRPCDWVHRSPFLCGTRISEMSQRHKKSEQRLKPSVTQTEPRSFLRLPRPTTRNRARCARSRCFETQLFQTHNVPSRRWRTDIA